MNGVYLGGILLNGECVGGFRSDFSDVGEIGVFTSADTQYVQARLNRSASCGALPTSYVWDAENRLIAVLPPVPQAGDSKVAFGYDHMNRRERMRVYGWSGSNWSATPSRDLKFVYDGWNVVQVLDGLNSDAVLRRYAWGLDLSGSMHGAGGIGGLLSVLETLGTTGTSDDLAYWFTYDGNGNVSELLDATDPADPILAGHYEYDAFGRAVVTADRNNSDYVNTNPFRFSTKWFDGLTGLGYWGHRYYSTSLGRWISRDPIGERGGILLYTYISNRPVTDQDLLGFGRRNKPGNKPLRNIKVSGVASDASVEELERLIKEAKLQGKKKHARHLEAIYKTAKRNATKGGDWIRPKGTVHVELVLVTVMIEVIILEVELIKLNVINELDAAESLTHSGQLDYWRSVGWRVAMDTEEGIDFHCCGVPFNDYDCRLSFRRQVATTYGLLYLEEFSNADTLQERVDQWVDEYEACNKAACSRIHRQSK